jgi:hypothetical protein
MANYHEAAGSSPYAHAFVSYQSSADPTDAGTFELTNGLDNLSLARFWVTDERDHTLRTKSTVPMHFGLVIRIETSQKKRMRNDDIHALMREMVGMQRLQLLQNDRMMKRSKRSEDDTSITAPVRRGLLSLQNEFDHIADPEDIIRHRRDDDDFEEGDTTEDNTKTYRDFLLERFERTRDSPYYATTDTAVNDRGQDTPPGDRQQQNQRQEEGGQQEEAELGENAA